MIYGGIISGILFAETMIKKYMKEDFSERKKENPAKKGESYLQYEVIENKGGCGGILAGHPKVIRGISQGILLCAFLELLKEKQKKKVTAAGIGLALILGGGFSNLADRLRKGSVTDYLRFPRFPVKKIRNLVFNLGDLCIFVGILLLSLRKK